MAQSRVARVVVTALAVGGIGLTLFAILAALTPGRGNESRVAAVLIMMIGATPLCVIALLTGLATWQKIARWQQRAVQSAAGLCTLVWIALLLLDSRHGS